MAEANVTNFVELNTKAQDARYMIELIDRQTGRLEGGMPTGLAANVELNLRRFGELVGRSYDPASYYTLKPLFQRQVKLLLTRLKTLVQVLVCQMRIESTLS